MGDSDGPHPWLLVLMYLSSALVSVGGLWILGYALWELLT